MRFRLRLIELENFRGFKGAHRVDVEDGLTIICGPVGSGKSSIIQAVHYALYGTQLEVKERISRLADLVNEDSTYARVRLRLASQSSALEVERTLRRTDDRVRETSQLVLNGAVVRRDVESEIVRLLNLDEDDFSRFVLVTHRTLESLVYGTSARRSIVIDRLFGIDVLDGICRALPIKRIEDLIEREKRKIVGIRELPEIISRYGSIERAKSSLEQMRGELNRLRELESELSKRYSDLIRRRAEVLERLKGVESVYAQYVTAKRELEELSKEVERASEVSETSLRVDLELIRSHVVSKLEELLMISDAEELSKIVITSSNLDECLAKVYESVRKLERALERLKESRESLARLREELEARYRALDNEARSIERALSEYDPKVREYRRLVEEHGAYEDVKRKIENYREKIERLEAELRAAQSVIELYNYITSSKTGKCPLCGKELNDKDVQDIAKTVESLRMRMLKDRPEVSEIRGKLAQLEQALTKMTLLKPIVNEYESLTSKLSELREQMRALLGKIDDCDKSRREVERRIQALTAFLDTIRSRIDDVERRLQMLKKLRRFRELRSLIGELERKLEQHGVDVKTAISLEEELMHVLNQLESTRARIYALSGEITRLETVLPEVERRVDVDKARRNVEFMSDLLNKLNTIRDVLTRAQTSLREEVVSRVKSLLSENFKQLYAYNDLVDAGLYVRTRRRGNVVVSEYVLYSVRSSGRSVTISRMSDGQRLTLALSFMLSVYRAANHNVDFIIMDEPVPYVDAEMRRSFSRLVAKMISNKLVGQVIIATQSEELKRSLIEEARGSKVPVRSLTIVRGDGTRRIAVEL